MSSHIDSTVLEAELLATLSEKRYQHSVAVGETCLRLQQHYQVILDREVLYQCGLMHDLARDWPAPQLIAYAQNHELPLEPEEQEYPVLLHAPVGASLLVKREFPDQLCRAVRYHTIGSPHMGKMGLVLYIADYMEPNRRHLTDDDRAILLREPSLEALCLRIIEAEHVHLQGKGRSITHSGQALHQFLVKGGKM